MDTLQAFGWGNVDIDSKKLFTLGIELDFWHHCGIPLVKFNKTLL